MVVLKAAPASLIPWDPGLFFLPGFRTSLHLHVLTPPAAFPVPPLPLPLSCGVNSPAGSGLRLPRLFFGYSVAPASFLNQKHRPGLPGPPSQ